jgi:hypothetical protein
LNGLHYLRWRLKSRQAAFEEVYTAQSWCGEESGSGIGSELRATGNARERLPELLTRIGADCILDAPCGDWNWMQHMTLPVKQYYGIDIVPHVIEANRAQFANERRDA